MEESPSVMAALAVLILLLLHFQILAAINGINRELDSIDYELSRMDNRLALGRAGKPSDYSRVGN